MKVFAGRADRSRRRMFGRKRRITEIKGRVILDTLVLSVLRKKKYVQRAALPTFISLTKYKGLGNKCLWLAGHLA